MRTIGCLLFCVALPPAAAFAQDTIEFRDGTERSGKVAGADEQFFRLRLPSPMPGQPPATVAIKRSDVAKIVFGPEAELEALARDPAPGRLAAARVLWQRLEPFLAVPESPAAKAGVVYGGILLLASDPARHAEALAVFQRIEGQAWDGGDRENAKRGRLQSLLRLGRLDEASAEVRALAEQAEDPALLLETKLLEARTRLAALRRLLEENPRWDEDPPVRAERNQLLHDALDLALYPFLFHGTAHEQAAQGLWLAHEAHLLAGDRKAAREVATDITTIYPETPYAPRAREALQEKPPES